jgi:phage shock protein A
VHNERPLHTVPPAQGQADQWMARAELAVSRGEDDLAREALRRRKVLQEDAGERVRVRDGHETRPRLQ